MSEVQLAADDRMAAAAVSYRHAGRRFVTIVAKATFSIVEDGVAVPTAPAPIVRRSTRWDAIETAPRLFATDVLLRANAFHSSPQGGPSRAVGFGIHRDNRPIMHKVLYVYGDYKNGALAPFFAMPIEWERAFGGPGSDANPVGCGVVPGGRVPNIVDARNARHPAGFGPIAPHWPIRSRLLPRGLTPEHLEATSDDREVLIPDEVPFSFFHAAPADQRVPFLTGDEWLVFDGMHPRRERFQSRLPGVRAVTAVSDGAAPTDVPMVIDMLSIDLVTMRLTCVFRGHVERRPDARWMRVFVGMVLEGGEVLYTAPPSPDLHDTLSLDEAGHERAASKAPTPYTPSAVRVAANQPVVPGAPWAPPAPKVRPAMHNEPTFDLGPLLKPPGPPAPMIELESADTESVREGPPPVMPFGQAPAPAAAPVAAAAPPPGIQPAAPVHDVAPESAATPLPQPPPSMRVPPVAAPPIELLEASDAPPGSMRPEETGIRKSVLDRVAAGLAFGDLDLAGADLSGLDLSNARLAGADLNHAMLVGAKLTGANLTGTKLASADLRGASCERADFSRSDLSRAILENADLRGATLEGANLQLATLTSSQLDDARSDRADFGQARCEQASFRGASLREADFSSATLDGATFANAMLDGARFASARGDGVTLRGASLEGARLQNATLAGVDAEALNALRVEADGADLSRARLVGAKLGGASMMRTRLDGCDATGASFDAATLGSANLDGGRLAKASFVGADLRQARLSDASAPGSTWTRANAQRVIASRIDLEGAELGNAVLRFAKLDKAKLCGARLDGCDLRDANLDGADLSRVDRSKARWAGANLKGAVTDAP